MTYTFRKSSLAAVSLALLFTAAGPLAPASAQATRDKVLATISEAAKTAGAKEFTWGTVSGSDAEFTVESTKGVFEKDGKTSEMTAEKIVYSSAKPTADGGFSADAITATDVEIDADDSNVTVATLKVTGYVGGKAAGERFDRLEATDIEVTDENDKKIPIDTITVTAADFVAGVPRRVGFDMKGLVVPVDPADAEMKDVAELGYKELAIDASFSGSWDDKTGRVVIDQMAVTGADIGGLKLTFALGGFTPEVMEGFKKAENDQAKQMELLQGVTVERLSLRYEDASLAKRMIDAQAKKQGVPADAFVQQINAIVPMMLSAIGNKDFEKKIAAAAGTFLKAPKSLTVSASPAKPLPVSEIMGAAMMAPQSLPTVLGAEVKAND